MTPDTISVEEGEDVLLTCYAQRNAKWLFNNSPDLPAMSKVGASRNKDKYYLKIYDATLESSGIYTCLGEDMDEVFFEAEAEVIVTSEMFNSLYILFTEQ